MWSLSRFATLAFYLAVISGAQPLVRNELSLRRTHPVDDNTGQASQDRILKNKSNKPVDFGRLHGSGNGGVESEVDGLIEILIHH